MAFRFNYRDVDSPNRAGASADVAPTRGKPDGSTGTKPDLLSREFYRARFFLITKTAGGAEDTAGTADVQVWFRDMVEIGDADNVAPNPPDPTKVPWVKGPSFTALPHLKEVILENVYKRGVFLQVTNIAGGAAAQADIFLSPFDRAYPWKSVD